MHAFISSTESLNILQLLRELSPQKVDISKCTDNMEKMTKHKLSAICQQFPTGVEQSFSLAYIDDCMISITIWICKQQKRVKHVTDVTYQTRCVERQSLENRCTQ